MKGVYKTNFPDNPPFPFNYTGTPPSNTEAVNETRVKVLPFNTIVQLILKETSIFITDGHPVHIHGFNFFVVGQGVGNYNEFIISQCNEPTSDGTTMFDLTIDWLSQVSLQLITLMPYSKHECGTHRTQKKTNQCGCHQSSLPTP